MNTMSHRVTLHAVIRYCQRVLGAPLLCDERKVGGLKAAETYAQYFQMTVQQIQYEIISIPAVFKALKLRAHSVITNKFVIIFGGNDHEWHIVTINTPKTTDRRTAHRKRRQKETREFRRQQVEHSDNARNLG